MKKVLIDCDPSVDDALAIMLALESKELQIEGITAVSGVCHVDLAAENALKILSLCGREDIPVAKGESQPLVRELIFDNKYCGEDGLSEVYLPSGNNKTVPEPAVMFLRRKIMEHPGEIHIISIGPMTNLARLLTEYPEVTEQIASIITISGSYGVAPDKSDWNPRPTWNVLVDPEAAKIVIESGILIQAAGFDVTGTLTDDMVERIFKEGNPQSEKYAFLKKAVDFNLRNGLKSYSLLVDSVAVAVAAVPELASFIEGKAAVETKGEVTLGQTLFGTKGYLDHKKSRVLAAYHLDKEKLTELLIARVFR